MLSIEPVVTLSSLLTHPDVADMCILDLIDNGYRDDMDDHYVAMSAVDQGDSFEEVEEMIVTEVVKVNEGMWIDGCLYTEKEIVAFKLKGREGLWTLDTLTGEQ